MVAVVVAAVIVDVVLMAFDVLENVDVYLPTHRTTAPPPIPPHTHPPPPFSISNPTHSHHIAQPLPQQLFSDAVRRVSVIQQPPSAPVLEQPPPRVLKQPPPSPLQRFVVDESMRDSIQSTVADLVYESLLLGASLKSEAIRESTRDLLSLAGNKTTRPPSHGRQQDQPPSLARQASKPPAPPRMAGSRTISPLSHGRQQDHPPSLARQASMLFNLTSWMRSWVVLRPGRTLPPYALPPRSPSLLIAGNLLRRQVRPRGPPPFLSQLSIGTQLRRSSSA